MADLEPEVSSRRDRAEEDALPPQPPQRGKDRPLWVGLFVILGVGATLLALFTLTDAALFRGRYIVTTVVNDAGGIRRGDPVQMRGVNIGRILDFRMVPEGVAIRLEVEGEYPIPEDSRVEIRSSGLLQGMVADVLPGQSTRLLGNGDSLPGATEAGMVRSADTLATQAQTVLLRAEELLSRETIRNVEESSKEVRSVLRELSQIAAQQKRDLAELSKSLRQSSSGLERITADVQRATQGPELERAVKRVDSLTARLDETTGVLERSSRSLETVLGRLERGEGTLGKLARDETLYANLNEAALNLSRLAEDVRKQPKRYVKLSLF